MSFDTFLLDHGLLLHEVPSSFSLFPKCLLHPRFFHLLELLHLLFKLLLGLPDLVQLEFNHSVTDSDLVEGVYQHLLRHE